MPVWDSLKPPGRSQNWDSCFGLGSWQLNVQFSST